jgi:fucose 4-O-acetylase-like acetyltransferase
MFKCIYIVEHLFTFCVNLYVAVLYFLGVATIAALVAVGHVVTKVIAILGRASLIIFILVGTIQRPID